MICPKEAPEPLLERPVGLKRGFTGNHASIVDSKKTLVSFQFLRTKGQSQEKTRALSLLDSPCKLKSSKKHLQILDLTSFLSIAQECRFSKLEMVKVASSTLLFNFQFTLHYLLVLRDRILSRIILRSDLYLRHHNCHLSFFRKFLIVSLGRKQLDHGTSL